MVMGKIVAYFHLNTRLVSLSAVSKVSSSYGNYVLIHIARDACERTLRILMNALLQSDEFLPGWPPTDACVRWVWGRD